MAHIGRIGLRVGACLSLTGRYARFGTQAAAGLAAWRALDGDAELVVEDDGSDPARLAASIGGVAARCDLLLGPYSTRLARAAARALADGDRVIWNHGGAGDDVMAARPGGMVSVSPPPAATRSRSSAAWPPARSERRCGSRRAAAASVGRSPPARRRAPASWGSARRPARGPGTSSRPARSRTTW